jgi:hypothetical protein
MLEPILPIHGPPNMVNFRGQPTNLFLLRVQHFKHKSNLQRAGYERVIAARFEHLGEAAAGQPKDVVASNGKLCYCEVLTTERREL